MSKESSSPTFWPQNPFIFLKFINNPKELLLIQVIIYIFTTFKMKNKKYRAYFLLHIKIRGQLHININEKTIFQAKNKNLVT